MGSTKWFRGMILSLALMILGSAPAFAVGGKYGIEAEDEASVNNAGSLVVDGTVAPTSPHVEGIHATNTTGNVANSGSIDASASDESASAYGIGANITDGDIVNSGDIEATANSIDYAYAYGIMAQGTLGSILNSGSILAEAEAHNTYAAGIDARDTGSDIINSGDIRAYARSMVSGAYGLNIDGAEGDVVNSGDIFAYAESDVSTSAWGIFADEVAGSILNSGSIIAETNSLATADAWGIQAQLTGGDIVNDGLIEADADGDSAQAKGIYASETGGDIRNTGMLRVRSTGDEDGFSFGIWTYDTDGDIDNSGTILVSATGTDDEAQARGIFSDLTGGGIVNSGTISLSTEAGDETYIYGAIDAERTGGRIVNSGVLEATGTAPHDVAVYAFRGNKSYAGILNTGSISASASAGGASGDRSDAWGLYAYETVGDIINEGQIDVTASGYTAYSWGIFATDTQGSVINSGLIESSGLASSGGQARGIYSSYADGDVINSGTLIAHALGESYDAYPAEGIYAQWTSGNVINSGIMEVTASAGDYAEAVGIIARQTDGGIINSGSIFVLASGIEGYSTAWGADLNYVGGPVVNTGLIDVEATGPDTRAYGLELSTSNSSIVNSGEIRVTGAQGAGLYLGSGNWDIYNPGLILTSGGTRTLWVRNAATGTLVDDFRIIFDGDPESMDYLAPLLASYGGTLNLNDATLLAQAGNDIVWNTPYPVIENDASTVNGEFGGLRSVNPNIAVSWDDAGSTGEDAAVVFDYAPKASAAAQGLRMANLGVMQAGNLIQQRTFSELLARYVRQQETMLADSGQTASDSGFLVARAADGSGSAAFIRPYLHTVNRPSDGDMGYDGSLLGIVAGYEWLASRELTMGLHAGVGVGSIDFKGTGYDANDEEQQVYSLGLHGAYNPGAWHFDGSATLYAANHEYEGLTGGGLTIEEEDDYTSYGAEAEAIGGYVFSSGRWAAMPYAGLGYSWINAPSHTSDADDSNWDTDYDSVDEHIVRSILGGQISGNWAAGETKIIPTLGLRWEYALTDNEISVSQSLPGTGSVEVDDEVDQSSFIADASVVFVKGAASMELGATSLYNDDYTSYGGWLTLKWEF